MPSPPNETEEGESLTEATSEFRFEFRKNTLAGRVVLLPGGSGGLGSATASLLAREGARLVIGYRSNRARAEALRQSLAETNVTVELAEGDLNEPGVAERHLRQASKLGPLAGLAVFAGDPARSVSSGSSVPSEVSESPDASEMRRLETSWKTNFAGPYLLARRAAEHMVSQGAAGSIVLVATMQAIVPFENSVAYSAPKAALVHAARVLAYEFGAAKNICVNVVAPGVTTAGMAQASVASGKYERFVKEKIIPRYGRAEDVARVVRFLLEPDSYITGQVITVDGGLTLRRGITQ